MHLGLDVFEVTSCVVRQLGECPAHDLAVDTERLPSTLMFCPFYRSVARRATGPVKPHLWRCWPIRMWAVGKCNTWSRA